MRFLSQKSPVIFAIFIAVFVPIGRAEETIIPTAIPPQRYHVVWDNSPFTREVVKPVETVADDPLNQNWVLEGLIEDDQVGHIAYVRDLATEKLLVITSKKSDDHLLVVVSAVHASDPGKAKVKIFDGTKSTDIGFAANSLTSAIASPTVGNSGDKPRPAITERPGASAARPLGGVRTAKTKRGIPPPDARTSPSNGTPVETETSSGKSTNPASSNGTAPTNEAKDKRGRKLRILPER